MTCISFSGCCNKGQQIGLLKLQDCTVLEFWRLEIRDQGVRCECFLKAVRSGESALCLTPSS